MTHIIADACCNHMGDRKVMEKMIKAAAEVGVDYIKFQSVKADKLNPQWEHYSKEKLMYYKKHELSEADHLWLIDKCKQYGVNFLTTVFDLETVDFLCQHVDTVKIASPDCNNWALIDKCLDKFERVLISTGMHSKEEIAELVQYLTTKKALGKATILHCVSLYPTPPDKVNMLHINALMKVFPSVGFSDHTLGTDAAKLAISLGASCVEKHFTLNRNLPGKDQHISATRKEFEEIVGWRRKVQTMMYCPESNIDHMNRHYIGRWTNA